MNTNQLKRFAKDARIKLLDQVGRKLEFVLNNRSQSFIDTYAAQIQSLTDKIQQTGREQVIEMVSYTWFNRLMALRFMDANGYTLPKVVTPLPGMTNPEILQNALAGNIETDLILDRQRLNDLLDGRTVVADAHTEAYKMLLVATCNQWHKAMPFMFEHISDYTELLLPDDLLSDYSIVADLRTGMSDEDCLQEEVIGWLYQFYISDKKDEVFEGLKKNIKIAAENIPAATQLFTPRWIVRYMVENTLGKLWLSLKPNSKLREYMLYFIEAPEGNSPAPLPEGINGVTDITFLDPCQGSGHVLVYAFDLFTKIYEEEGYNTNEIPALILQHNLFGIDIDQRAAQLAAFALTMKARSYYSRFLRKPVQPHVIALENVSEETIQQSVKLPFTIKGRQIEKYSDLSLSLLTQANSLGSLIQIRPEEVDVIQIQQNSIWHEQQKILKLQAEFLSRRYHCVVTNPPYMGGKGMNDELKVFLDKYFNEGKSDTFAAFIIRCQDLLLKNGFQAMITMESWMFLTSFEAFRKKLLENIHISSLIHMPYLGKGGTSLGISFGTSAFVLHNTFSVSKGVYQCIRYYETDDLGIPFTFPTINTRYNSINQKDFEKIQGMPIGYWVSKHTFNIFSSIEKLESYTHTSEGIKTGNNERFLRKWFEVEVKEISHTTDIYENKKWDLLHKGGEKRKWYGNIENVIFWENNGETIKSMPNSGIQGVRIFNEKAFTWSDITTAGLSFRYKPQNHKIDSKGPSGISNKPEHLDYIIAFLNSKVVASWGIFLNPTISFKVGNVRKIPYVFNNVKYREIDNLSKNSISISKNYWDAHEFSLDFQQNELIKYQNSLLKSAFDSFKTYWATKFNELHQNEEELNRQFIEIYGLQDELTPEVPLEEITILQEEAKIVENQMEIQTVPVLLQLLSYSIGCMFGRYSLDKPGLILANQGENLQDYLNQISSPSFLPDDDNIIPVLDGEWFTDDIVGRFNEFLKVAFGEEHFGENLRYIEDALGKDIRKYLVKDFYNDHIKRYKKRPIYWMFSSPKGHFKALIYMHRYQPDVCSRMLNDYLLAFISKLESAKNTQTMFSLREDITGREKTLASKEIERLEDMLKDCRKYESTLFTIATQKINIDLDDGVKVNYQKFKEVLVPIKGLEKEEE